MQARRQTTKDSALDQVASALQSISKRLQALESKEPPRKLSKKEKRVKKEKKSKKPQRQPKPTSLDRIAKSLSRQPRVFSEPKAKFEDLKLTTVEQQRASRVLELAFEINGHLGRHPMTRILTDYQLLLMPFLKEQSLARLKLWAKLNPDRWFAVVKRANDPSTISILLAEIETRLTHLTQMYQDANSNRLPEHVREERGNIPLLYGHAGFSEWKTSLEILQQDVIRWRKDIVTEGTNAKENLQAIATAAATKRKEDRSKSRNHRNSQRQASQDSLNSQPRGRQATGSNLIEIENQASSPTESNPSINLDPGVSNAQINTDFKGILKQQRVDELERLAMEQRRLALRQAFPRIGEPKETISNPDTGQPQDSP